MAIFRLRPLEELNEFLEEHRNDIPVDLYEEEGYLIAEMHVPGIDPEEIEISVEDNYLRVSGSREEEEEEEKEEEEGKKFFKKEIRRGYFERLIPLPVAVDQDNVRAEFEDGVLTIEMPKERKAEGKKVRVERR